MSWKLLACSRSHQVAFSHCCASCSNPQFLHPALQPQGYTPSNEPVVPLQLGSLTPVAQNVSGACENMRGCLYYLACVIPGDKEDGGS